MAFHNGHEQIVLIL